MTIKHAKLVKGVASSVAPVARSYRRLKRPHAINVSGRVTLDTWVFITLTAFARADVCGACQQPIYWSRDTLSRWRTVVSSCAIPRRQSQPTGGHRGTSVILLAFNDQAWTLYSLLTVDKRENTHACY